MQRPIAGPNDAVSVRLNPGQLLARAKAISVTDQEEKGVFTVEQRT